VGQGLAQTQLQALAQAVVVGGQSQLNVPPAVATMVKLRAISPVADLHGLPANLQVIVQFVVVEGQYVAAIREQITHLSDVQPQGVKVGDCMQMSSMYVALAMEVEIMAQAHTTAILVMVVALSAEPVLFVVVVVL
jgi:hypothetical protein